MKVIFDNLKKSDANKLKSWWNANTKFYHFIEKSGKLWKLVRQL